LLHSYTTFGYSGLKVENKKKSWLNKGVHPGGQSYLYDEAYCVTIDVMNTGKVAGNVTPQLYLGFPASAQEPPKVLKGFNKVYLKPGKSQKVTFNLRYKGKHIVIPLF